jgi:hypothetical protein
MLVRPLCARFCLVLGLSTAAVCGWVPAQAAETPLSGTYQGHAPAADAAQRVFTLNLDTDGSAVLTTQYIGKSKASESGRWVENGSEVILSFDAIGSGRPPRPITFRYHGHKLSPLHWDSSEWGGVGPPVLSRAHTRAGL